MDRSAIRRVLGNAGRDDRVGGLEEERTGPAGEDDELAIDAPPDAARAEEAGRLLRGRSSRPSGTSRG